MPLWSAQIRLNIADRINAVDTLQQFARTSCRRPQLFMKKLFNPLENIIPNWKPRAPLWQHTHWEKGLVVQVTGQTRASFRNCWSISLNHFVLTDNFTWLKSRAASPRATSQTPLRFAMAMGPTCHWNEMYRWRKEIHRNWLPGHRMAKIHWRTDSARSLPKYFLNVEPCSRRSSGASIPASGRCELVWVLGGRQGHWTTYGLGHRPQATDSDNVTTDNVGDPLIVCTCREWASQRFQKAGPLAWWRLQQLHLQQHCQGWATGQVPKWNWPSFGGQEPLRGQHVRLQCPKQSSASLPKGLSVWNWGSQGQHHKHVSGKLR